MKEGRGGLRIRALCVLMSLLMLTPALPAIQTAWADPQKTVGARASIVWEGDGIGTPAETASRPKSIPLELLYSDDGGATWQSANQPKSAVAGADPNKYECAWSDLPAQSNNGAKRSYKAQQADAPEGYASSADEPVFDSGANSWNTTIHNAYNDNWNYKVDFHWDSADPAQWYDIQDVTTAPATRELKAVLNISTQKNYPAGALRVELPYKPFKGRSGDTWYGISDIGLGKEGQESPNQSLTWKVDDKGTPDDPSDDVVVIYNYKPLNATNFTATLSYSVPNTHVKDGSFTKIVAKASGQYDGQAQPELKELKPVTYYLDTGLQQPRDPDKRTKQLIYEWNENQHGKKPADFDMDKYNYVLYEIENIECIGNQPYTMTVRDRPSDGGKVVNVLYNTYYGAPFDDLATANVDAEGQASWSFDSYYSSFENAFISKAYAFCVVVAYPRVGHPDPLNPGQTTYDAEYKNEVSVEYRGIDEAGHAEELGLEDKNDSRDTQADTTTSWRDYEFHYDGDAYDFSKRVELHDKGALTVLEYGVNVDVSSWINATYYGYNFTDGYRYDIVDDAVILDDTRLAEGDYEFSGKPRLMVTATTIDRKTGTESSLHLPDEPFVLYGRKGTDGAWEKIGESEKEKEGNIYFDFPDITGRGYTALKVSSPEGIKEKNKVTLHAVYTLNASSENVKRIVQELNDRNASNTLMENIAATDLYVSKDGVYEWANPQDKSVNTLAKDYGVDDEDKKAFGSYRFRKNDGEYLTRPAQRSEMKKIVRTSPDASAEVLSARYSLVATERIWSTALPDDVYRQASADEAVFYDLLPRGFALDRSRPVTAYQHVRADNLNKRPGFDEEVLTNKLNIVDYAATVADIEVEDNWRGTGRQMVSIKVKANPTSDSDPAANKGNWSISDGHDAQTGFIVDFYAGAAYASLEQGATAHNVAAYQRTDRRDIVGGYEGYGFPTHDASALPTDDIWPLGKDGKPALSDVDGDGKTGSPDTLYASAPQQNLFLETIENGLHKKVRGVSPYYAGSDRVEVGGAYSYELKFTTSEQGDTSDVVVYDVLENAENTEEHTGEAASWKGALTSVDVSQAEALGIDAVVWYTTETGLSYNDEDALRIDKNPGIWSKTPPADLSKVTALAIDLRYAEDGSSFVFKKRKTVFAGHLYFDAPDALIDGRPYAYNRPAYSSTITYPGQSSPYSEFNIATRTTLELRLDTDLKIKKTATASDGTKGPLAGAEFSVLSADGATVIQGPTATADDGTVTFEDLKPGTYLIRETKVPTGYQKLIGDLTLKIAKDGTATLDGHPISDDHKGIDDLSGRWIQIDIDNERVASLPTAGGLGALPWVLAGLACLCLGALAARRTLRSGRWVLID
ncbi:MAG: prealbumin-like fold domain-containing protein [Atopobiaceae bacterium]|nr:prealbumin-like fold domain-containing protein [Atopobiaceae bacterium]